MAAQGSNTQGANTQAGSWTLKFWDPATGQELTGLAAGDVSADSLSYSPDGKLLAVAVHKESAAASSDVQVWRMPEGRLLHRWTSKRVLSLEVSQDSASVAAATENGIRVWSVESPQREKEIPERIGNSAVAFSRVDGMLAVVAGEKVQIWSTNASEPKREIPIASGWPVSVAFSPAGKILAIGDTAGTIHVFDVVTNREIATTPRISSWILSLAFSTDSRTLFSGDALGDLNVWSIDGKLLRTLLRGGPAIRTLVLQPQQTIVAVGLDDHRVQLIDTVTGRVLRTMGTGSGFVSAIAFSPDGRVMATGATLTSRPRAPGMFLLAIDSITLHGAGVQDNFHALAERLSTVSADNFERTVSINLSGTGALQASIEQAVTRVTRDAKPGDTLVLLFRTGPEVRSSAQQPADWISKMQANNVAVLLEGPQAAQQAEGIRQMVERDRRLGSTKNLLVLWTEEDRLSRIANALDPGSTVGGKLTAASFAKAVTRRESAAGNVIEADLVGSDFILGSIGKASDTRGIGLTPPVSEAPNARTEKRQDYAVLFATNQYNDFPSLTNPVIDAHALGDELRNSYDFQTEIVENPTVDEIFSKLRSLRVRNFAEGDQLLIFFAGHGSFDDESSEGFLVAKDSSRDDPNKTSYVSYSRLRTLVDGLPAKHIFLVMDVCFGGTFDRRIAEGGSRGGDEYAFLDLSELLKRKMRLPTRKYLTSGAKEYVPDGVPGHHSPFAAHMLEALRTYGGERGYLTISSLLADIEATKPEPVWGEWGHDEPGSDFLFVPRETKQKLEKGEFERGKQSYPLANFPPAGFVQRRSVALLGIKNLTGQSDASWISPTLTTVLSTEVAKNEDILLVPEESVARTKSDLRLAENESYSTTTLQRLRSSLHADVVIAGSVLALGSPGARQIRIDLQIQDTSAGGTLGVVSDSASEADFMSLVTRVGAQLRFKLGGEKAIVADASDSALWKNSEAARLYVEGRKQMEKFAAASARDLLQKSAVIEPDVALTHVALSESLSFLGYDSLAREEAKRGFNLAAGLPREQKFRVEAQYYASIGQWDHAIETYRSLWTFYPDNLEYGLSLADVQTAGGRPQEASATIVTLHGLPPPYNEDPRIDLAEANAAMVLTDASRQAEAAARARLKTENLGAQQLLAQSHWYECVAQKQLGQLDEALVSCQSGKQLAASFGDPRLLARCVTGIANIYAQRGDLQQALLQNQEALKIVRDASAMKDVSGALVNTAGNLRDLGNVDSAANDYTEAIHVSQEIGDREGEALAELGLASLLNNMGQFDSARKHFENSENAYRDIHDDAHVAMCRAYSSEILWGQGYVGLALERLQEAVATARRLRLKSSLAEYLVYLGDIYRSQEKLKEAEDSYSESLALHNELKEGSGIANSKVGLALLALERDQFQPAQTCAEDASKEFASEQDEDDEAFALSIVADALSGSGKIPQAVVQIDQAHRLKITSPTTKLSVEMTAARVYARAGKRSQAENEISHTLQDAESIALSESIMEARLAQNEVRLANGESDLARTDLQSLAAEASGRGFTMISTKARKLLQ